MTQGMEVQGIDCLGAWNAFLYQGMESLRAYKGSGHGHVLTRGMEGLGAWNDSEHGMSRGMD